MAEKYINIFERWGCNSTIAGQSMSSWHRLEIRVGDFTTIILTVAEAELVLRHLSRMVENVKRARDAERAPPSDPPPRPVSARRSMSDAEREAFCLRMAAGRARKAQGIEARRAETQGGSVHESPVAESDAP